VLGEGTGGDPHRAQVEERVRPRVGGRADSERDPRQAVGEEKGLRQARVGDSSGVHAPPHPWICRGPPPRNRPRLEESPHALLRQEKQAQPSLSHSGPVTLPEPSSSVAVHLWSWGETKAEEATRTHLQHKNAHVGLFRTLRVRGLDTRMRFPRRHWTQGAGPR
jgi:hypothetical protein